MPTDLQRLHSGREVVSEDAAVQHSQRVMQGRRLRTSRACTSSWTADVTFKKANGVTVSGVMTEDCDYFTCPISDFGPGSNTTCYYNPEDSKMVLRDPSVAAGTMALVFSFLAAAVLMCVYCTRVMYKGKDCCWQEGAARESDIRKRESEMKAYQKKKEQWKTPLGRVI
eukprot:PLAT8076.1.p2 GENE.PLAT8076.1~~PLAT8076.1.p2  ORF type:complete len:169 (-),score=28.91 PLAT8076.1:123-629(-)